MKPTHIENSIDVIPLIKNIKESSTEKIVVLGIDNNDNVIYKKFYQTKTNKDMACCDVRSLILDALQENVTGIIIAHNHPSLMVIPSKDDLIFTKELKLVCNFLDIQLYDHIILSKITYFSFDELNMIKHPVSFIKMKEEYHKDMKDYQKGIKGRYYRIINDTANYMIKEDC